MLRRFLLSGVSLGSLMLPVATMIMLSAEDASAQVVISGNQTTGQTVNLQSGTVQTGASIAVGASSIALQINGSNATLINNGTISNNNNFTSGALALPTVVLGNDNALGFPDNSADQNIFSFVNNGTITNNANLATQGVGAVVRPSPWWPTTMFLAASRIPERLPPATRVFSSPATSAAPSQTPG
jgi:hypothetical protein